MKRLVALTAAWIAFVPVAARAQGASLQVERLADPGPCLTDEALARMVNTRLGRTVLGAGAPLPGLAVRVRIEGDTARHAWRITLMTRSPRGGAEGVRTLEVGDTGCADLLDALALMISIAVGAQPPPVPAPVPVISVPRRWGLAAGGGVAGGTLPWPAPWLEMRLQRAPVRGPAFSLGAEALAADVHAAAPTGGARFLAFGMVAALHPVLAQGRVHLSAYLALALDGVSARGRDFDQLGASFRWVPAARAGLEARWPLGPRWALWVRGVAGAQAPGGGYVFRGRDGSTTDLWRPGVLTGAAAVGVALSF